MLSRVDRHHLNGGHRRQAFENGMAQDAIHVAISGDSLRVRVVGNQNKATRVESVFCDRFDLRRDIVPGRAISQHRFHTLTDAR